MNMQFSFCGFESTLPPFIPHSPIGIPLWNLTLQGPVSHSFVSCEYQPLRALLLPVAVKPPANFISDGWSMMRSSTNLWYEDHVIYIYSAVNYCNPKDSSQKRSRH
jgi:hypothetical protein